MDLLTLLLFLTTLVLFPAGQIVRLNITSGIALSALDIGVFICVFSFLVYKLSKRDVSFNFFSNGIVIFEIIGTLSLIGNFYWLGFVSFLISLLYLIRFGLYTCTYFVTVSIDKRNIQKLTFSMLISGLLLLIVGFIQYFYYPNLRNLSYMGWDVHLYRMFSSFLDPNFFGVFLVLYFLFLVGLLIQSKRKDIFFGCLVCILMLDLVGILLTYSRSAIIALVIGLMCFVLVKKTSLKTIVLGIIIFAIICVSVFFISRRSEGTNLLRANSSEARFASIESGVSIFAKNPILGVGFNSYRYAAHKYGLSIGEKWQTSHAEAGSDNSLVNILAMTGTVGFLSVIYFSVKYFKSLWERRRDTWPTVVMSSLLALLASSFFVNSLFYPLNLFWMALLIGIMNTDTS